ncbi:hypothetical protein RIF29_25532 [Crotalaria pallida]|uniref:Uncharacterized protein n=1 Tax=Crotalaria pallida TaxID=3830 RepID=A0AAN9EMC6_CROPI
MQKFADLKALGTKLEIISAFFVDHMKGFVYIEAEKQCHISEVPEVFYFAQNVVLHPLDPLQPDEIAGVKTVVQQKVSEGVNSHGLTLPGFIYVHMMFLKKGHPETLWAVLRNFGYDNDLKLQDDFLSIPSKISPDQSVELTSEAVEFLNGIFRLLDMNKVCSDY